jgi:hypothetical protein
MTPEERAKGLAAAWVDPLGLMPGDETWIAARIEEQFVYIIAAERERCARIVEEQCLWHATDKLAAAIRGEKDET